MARRDFSRRKVARAIVGMLDFTSSTMRDKTTQKAMYALAAFLIQEREVQRADLYLKAIYDELERCYGLVYAEVTVQNMLQPALKKRIEDMVKKTTNAKKVEAKYIIDHDLLGGFVVDLVNARLDASIKTKLQKMRSI